MRILMTLLCCAACSSLQAEPPGTAIRGTASGIQLDPPTLHATFYIPKLNQEIEVHTNTEKNKFFVVPVLLPDWSRFKTDLDKWAKAKPGSAEVKKLLLKVKYRDAAVETELLEAVNELRKANGKVEISRSDLHIIPYAFYQIEANLGGGLVAVYSSVDLHRLQTEGVNLVNQTTINGSQFVPIVGTFQQLRYLYENRAEEDMLVGRLYSRGYSVRPVRATVHLHSLMQSSASTKMTGDEEFRNTTKVTNSHSGGGLSVNLGIAKFGGGKGKSSAESETSRKRIVSRHYVRNLVTSYSTHLIIGSGGKQGEMDSEIAQLVEFILATCQRTTLEFQKQSDNSWKLGNDLIGYVNLGEQQMKEVLSSKPKLQVTDDLKLETDAKLAVGKVQGSGKLGVHSKGNVVVSDDIWWTFDGKAWIPSKVDLYILDQTVLRNELRITWAKNIVAEDKQSYMQKFLHPAATLYEQEG